ncbi:MAG: phosphoribosylformylglycinamidine cyclo-ligase [Candidatus Omnitrophota bacterium]
MKIKNLTYKKAGVDIVEAEKLVGKIKKITGAAKVSVKSDIGKFAGAFDFFKLKIKKPVLVSSTDGVGTKLKIAFLAGKHDTVGIDMVAMNVNDILTVGAKPLFFLDYIATGKIESAVLSDVIKGIVKGCELADCALIGGETAEMPGFYKIGEYDLAGFCVGAAEKDKMLSADDTEAGDVLIGIASSGLHSNGFSLVRKVFTTAEQKKMASELLVPTRIYVKPVLGLLEKFNRRSKVIKAAAHVTGGAFYQKVLKIVSEGKAVNIYKNTWVVPEIFRLIQSKANIAEKEMFTTFNMGIGFVLAVKRTKANEIIKHLARLKLKSWVIGEVVKGVGTRRTVTIL